MSVDSLYCPECGHELTAPLMNLDYSLCKRCNMSVHVEDAERRSSQSILQGSWSRQKVQYLGVQRVVDAANRITRFYGTFGNIQHDSVVVMCLAHMGASGNPASTTICGQTPDDTRTKNHLTARVQISFAKVTSGGECLFDIDWTGVGTKPLSAAAHMFALSWMSDSPYFSHKDGTDDISGEGSTFSTVQMNNVPEGAVAVAIVAADTNTTSEAISIPSEITMPFVALNTDLDVNDYMVDTVAFIESTPAGALQFKGAYHDIVGESFGNQSSVQMFEVLR